MVPLEAEALDDGGLGDDARPRVQLVKLTVHLVIGVTEIKKRIDRKKWEYLKKEGCMDNQRRFY